MLNITAQVATVPKIAPSLGLGHPVCCRGAGSSDSICMLYPTHQQHEPLLKHLQQHLADSDLLASWEEQRHTSCPRPELHTRLSVLASLNGDKRQKPTLTACFNTEESLSDAKHSSMLKGGINNHFFLYLKSPSMTRGWIWITGARLTCRIFSAFLRASATERESSTFITFHLTLFLSL